ncbi:MAG: hypothetical protein AB7T49_03285 [Oligoflexales bacterium]
MSFNEEKSNAKRALSGLENGSMPASDIYQLASKIDPVLVHWIFRFLREKYPVSNPASAGVLQRVLGLTTDYPDLVKKAKKGEADLITEWFNDSYSVRDYFRNGEELLDVIFDKMDS